MPEPYPVAADQPAEFIEGNVRSSRDSWNGVDYSEFTTAHKKKIRAHYAALVKQVDDKVGEIIAALKDTRRYDNTIIVFCSDHGDYLGDHGLIGKGQYYESSTKVPLIVRMPDWGSADVHSGPISIEDITATLVHLAGCEVPDYMDSRPLPAIGIEGSVTRDVIYGFVASGAMCYDGTWKLARYSNGYGALFNIEEDPAEQHNCIDVPTCQEVRARLDALLSAQMLRSIHRAHAEKEHDTDWEDPAFAAGDGSWQRVYPQPMG
jgi:arylsulfatase A-like enzyme